MNILLDENIPQRTVTALRAAEHHVIDVRESANRGADDDQSWSIAQDKAALLVRTDKGFLRRLSAAHHGLLIVRLRQPNGERIHARIIRALAHFPESSWPGQTVVVRDHSWSVRQHRSPGRAEG